MLGVRILNTCHLVPVEGNLICSQVLHLTLARLLHAFELGTVSDTLVDMSGSPGMTLVKATPLEITIIPRLPYMLFEC